jgi:hypothetical protein
LVLDARVYRTAFLPALVALFVAAFALEDRPQPGRATLAPDVFSGARAFETLEALDATRRAGDAALAEEIGRQLAAPDDDGARPAFTVARDGPTVIATRTGFSGRRIVVLANRDAPGLAGLSGTAALLELARVFQTRDVDKTLVLVSTTGATTGFAGAREWAGREDGPVDGVIVLGDLAGTRIRKPWVVSWPASARPVPLGLERTVQAAIRRETFSDAGGPRAIGQWIRRALPVTVSAQGPIGAEGLPAVMISQSGERGPAADEPVLDSRLQVFGRAAVRAVSAVDDAGPRGGPSFGDAPDGIVTLRNVLPDWAARLVVGSLLLPALLAALDAFFRARRRRVPVGRWTAWLVVAAVPLPAAWLWLRLIGATGAIDVPDGPVLPHAFGLDRGGIVALVSAVIAAALATWGARSVARWRTRPPRPAEEAPNGRRGRPAPGVEGLAAATVVWIAGLAALAWAVNPYAAGLLIPAAHLWLFAAAGEWRLPAGILAAIGGLLPIALAFMHLALALGLGPHELAWGAVLAAMAGAGLWSTLLLGGLLAGLAGVVRVLAARRRLARGSGPAGAPILTRGPLGYAGPGSLGGTESALKR